MTSSLLPNLKERAAKRQANAAATLLLSHQPTTVWPLLKRSPPDDPSVRSWLIHRIAPLGVDADVIVKRLLDEEDVTIRRALILILGEFDDNRFSADERAQVVKKLQSLYSEHADPGLHGAVGWLLRKWELDGWLKQVNGEWADDKEHQAKRLKGIYEFLKKNKEKTSPQWYVTRKGQTMVVIPEPEEFTMGSPLTETQRQDREQTHQRKITWAFAIGAQTVTVDQYNKLVDSKHYDHFKPYSKANSPYQDCPMNTIGWFGAVAYCNWLSEEEGIPKEQWCYEIKNDETGSVTEVKVKQGYLNLKGYRLPTEAEWEYGCRAGSLTSRYYGDSEELLAKYGWYFHNSNDHSWPVGSLKPNDLGLFDMHGNMWNWCQDRFRDYPQTKVADVRTDNAEVITNVFTTSRIVRGGTFSDLPSMLRSATRQTLPSTSRNAAAGFRLARTIVP